MSEQQMHLFQGARPLLSRFGADFFRAIPKRPGVYIMGGETERVLYIGQSKNLRHRLNSYKNARPDRAPRKIIRLVHSVRTIVWEECDSPEAARLRENELLRLHRPRFNVMNVYPQAYRFISVDCVTGQLLFRLVNDPKAGGNIYGAFKSGCGRAYTSLLRLVWAVLFQPKSPFDFPAPLLAAKPPREYVFTLANLEIHHWLELVKKFLGGKSEELIHWLNDSLPRAETLCPFQCNLQTSDLEILTTFFERGPKRNQTLRQQHGIHEPIIAQEQLDDLLVIAGKRPNLPASLGAL